jgi:alpha-beta hydrolase superfamily lysophospholipase
MRHTEDTFKTASGYSIYHQCWLPDTEPVAVILLVHGLGEHSGRYQNLITHFVPSGYAICAPDHPGHGRSSGAREYIRRFDDYITTLQQFSAQVRHRYPGIPVFLLGHSMGGLIAARYLIEYQQEFSGAIISAPAIKVAGKVSLPTLWAGKLIAVLLPKLGLIALDAHALSRDPQVVSEYLADPLVCKDKTTARLAAEIVKTMQYVLEHAARISLPVLIVQGDADRIVDPQGAQLLHDALLSADKTLQVYEGLYHELFNEPEHEQVLADVAGWLAGRLESGRGRPD